MNLKTSQDFVDHMNARSLKSGDHSILSMGNDDFVGDTELGEYLELSNMAFSDLLVKQTSFFGIKFSNCTFTSCSFEKVEFNGIEFNDCLFSSCHLEDVTFMDMSMTKVKFEKLTTGRVYFGMMGMEEVQFIDGELQFATFSDCHIQGVIFNKTWLTVAKFESGDFYYAYKCGFIFDHAVLQDVVFMDLDLFVSKFSGCELENCSFNNSTLSASSIVTSKKSYRTSNIDFRTISKSEHLSKDTLEQVFGVYDPLVKDTVTRFLHPAEEVTVFISHSFQDQEFSDFLNDRLKKCGIRTFYWKQDALGGRNVKAIMADEIRKYDFFLFIASENSIKSKSCHFELQVAREKYHENWKNILIPVHIDKMLFTIEKYHIPLPFRDHFWENITELKEISSLDFSSYFQSSSLAQFELPFQKLLETLRAMRYNY